ncbi:HAD hydrolase family protein [bacterium]|jgi:hypothetical protein|nr:HAD hydrolase family protein [bacterium]
MKKYKTIFCDIDGTIFKYRKFETYESTPPELTPGSLEKLQEIDKAGHMIILTTARPESLRDHTIKELQGASVPYSRLIMGLERGPRYLINDMDPGKPGIRATAFNLSRDEGMSNVVVEEIQNVCW